MYSTTNMKSLTMFWVSMLMFISSLCMIHSHPERDLIAKLKLQNAFGPKDTAFDPRGGGPYTGVRDGRILKFSNGNFVDFAITSPFRTKEKCDGTNGTNLLSICGRPLGLDFNRRTGDLYIADIHFGLLRVGSNGGLAKQLAAGINGKNFIFADSVSLDQLTGDAYFVESGEIFLTNDFARIAQSGDTSGRLLKYEAATGQVTEVLTGLAGPVGNAISEDHTFIFITLFIGRKIIKHYIRGPKAKTTETVLENLGGNPEFVKRATSLSGGFWVPVNTPREQQPSPMTDSIAVKFDRNGKILETRNLTKDYPKLLGSYFEYFGKAYTGSLEADFVGVYRA
ncbi:PREDICTED: protein STRICTOSIDINE SYNTHASE-LIKE 11-like [Ipomoea nil]|uniref:protein STRICTOSIDINE SYNTHASE-LIKE 11-like n=1 Tax=Ipomoea nil TaxID=35883 RepID=UPI000901B437|nr:PREDICTED: protein STRICTOSIDINE SYNTHASE-LIKE 11-like [Ipomoea nil]